MATFDFYTSTAHIRDAMDDLQIAWQDTTDDWNDAVSRKFCEKHLEPIGPAVKMALDALGHISQQVRQMQRDCEV